MSAGSDPLEITAKFDLELKQLEVVNVLVNCGLLEQVLMMMPQQGSICRLRKVSTRSSLLWQLKLTDTFRRMSFKDMPQD